MALELEITPSKQHSKRISLSGALDSNTAPDLQHAIDASIDMEIRTVILEMQELKFISSAGLRVIFKLKKELTGRDGQLLMVHLQPQVRKVFEVITAVSNMHVFASLEELDEYLASIQKQVTDDNNSLQ